MFAMKKERVDNQVLLMLAKQILMNKV